MGRASPQPWHCSGRMGQTWLTLSAGTKDRCAPWWPGCPPGLRRLFLRRARRRCSPANPSEDGGLEELVEFCLRSANCRSKSAICFSFSPICFSFSPICFSFSPICFSHQSVFSPICFCSSAILSSRSFTSSRKRSNSRCCRSGLDSGWRGLCENRPALARPPMPAIRRPILALIHHSFANRS